MAKGEMLGGYCLSEAGAGSDAAALRCSATRDGDDWILDGAKLWITTGSEADAFIVFARTGEHRTRGISAFIVEKSFAGFGVGKKEEKLGLRASPTTEILLENCRVPGKNLLGEEGIGFKIALDTLDGGRLGIASQSVGIGRAALEESIKYAKTREQFGKAIGEFQAIGWKIAGHGHRPRRGSPADLAGGVAARSEAAVLEGGGHGQELRLEDVQSRRAGVCADPRRSWLHAGVHC
jgi:butyryl-CoA dehydrogenase